MRRLAACSVLAVFVAACASPSPSPPAAPSVSPSPVSPSAPQALTVPTVRWLSACRGIGLADATLTGDPADPRIAWLDLAGHGRRDVVFPPAVTARFAPSLERLDEAGRVVARAGDRIAGGCLTGSRVNDPLLILRP